MKTGTIRYNNQISYQRRENDDDKRRVTPAEVSTATGTAAAASTATRGGAWKTLKQFGFDTDKLTNVSAETRDTIKFAQKTTEEAKGLWAGIAKNSKRFTNAIIEWGQTVKANKFIKPILESGVYKKTAGVIGGATAIFVFVTGVGHMAKKVVNGVQEHSDKFIKLASASDDSKTA